MDFSQIKEQGLRVVTGFWGDNGWVWLHADVFDLTASAYIALYELEKCPQCNHGTVFVKVEKHSTYKYEVKCES